MDFLLSFLKSRTGSKLVTFYSIIFTLFSIPVYANNVLPPINLVTEHLPPFQILEKDQISGYATEIVKLALNNAEIDYSIKAYPWPRAYNLAQENKNTCIFSMARTKEREKLFKWTTTIATTNSDFIGLKSNKKIIINSLEDARKYNVAVIRNDVTHQLLLKHGFEENKNLYIINNTFSLLKLLTYRKNVDLILVDQLTVHYRARFAEIDPNIFKAYFRLNQAPLQFYLACSNQTEQSTVDELTTAIRRFKTTEEYHAVKRKWKSEDRELY